MTREGVERGRTSFERARVIVRRANDARERESDAGGGEISHLIAFRRTHFSRARCDVDDSLVRGARSRREERSRDARANP